MTTEPLADVIRELRLSIAADPNGLFPTSIRQSDLVQLLTAAEKAERYEKALGELLTACMSPVAKLPEPDLVFDKAIFKAQAALAPAPEAQADGAIEQPAQEPVKLKQKGKLVYNGEVYEVSDVDTTTIELVEEPSAQEPCQTCGGSKLVKSDTSPCHVECPDCGTGRK